MVKGPISGLMEISMKANGKTMLLMVMESTLGMTVRSTKDNGSWTMPREKVFSNGKMVDDMRVLTIYLGEYKND